MNCRKYSLLALLEQTGSFRQYTARYRDLRHATKRSLVILAVLVPVKEILVQETLEYEGLIKVCEVAS